MILLHMINKKCLRFFLLLQNTSKPSEGMAEIIGEEEIGDDDVFSVEDQAGSQMGVHSTVEAMEKNNKLLLIKVGSRNVHL